MSASSSPVDMERESESPASHGRTSVRSNFADTLLAVFSCLPVWIMFHLGHPQGQRGLEVPQGRSDVEMGLPGTSRSHDAASANGGSTQIADTIMGNQTVTTQAESGAGPPSSGIATLPTHQTLGQQVVGIWIVPIVIGVITGVIQVAVGIQKANSDQKLVLYVCNGIALVTIVLGIVLFILCFMQWNSPRKELIIKSIAVAALGSTFVDICVLITFGFILVHSKPQV